MKRLFVSLALSATICLSANAQEAFKHLSVGIELGTTGIGAELALPLVTDHLVLKAGAVFPNISASMVSDYDLTSFLGNANEYVSTANQYISLFHPGDPQMDAIPTSTKLDASAKLFITSFKAILEYYPVKNSGFHISAGIYAGNGQLFAADATASDVWAIYEKDLNISKKYPDMTEKIGYLPDLAATIDGRTYQIKSPGNINVGVCSAKVRPYLGVGFGKSVPETRWGFQFDLGAIYLGKVAFTSTNEVPYQPTAQVVTLDDNAFTKALKTLSKCPIYPVVNFRFICRLF